MLVGHAGTPAVTTAQASAYLQTYSVTIKQAAEL